MQGRFYFGELLEDSTGCDSDVSTVSFDLHSLHGSAFSGNFINASAVSVACRYC